MNNHHSRAWLACVLASVLAAAHAQETTEPATAAPPQISAEQQAMMAAWEKAGKPGAQHQRLVEQCAGTWDTRLTMWMDPAAPPMVETGKSENSAVLGGRHLRMAYTGQVMGEPFEGIGYTGYDNIRGKYTSLWMDNMSTGTMAMDGEYDLASRTYTFRGEMPDPMQGGKVSIPIRQTVKIVDADHHVLEMFETRDGKETRTMQIDYTRAKP